MGWISSMFYNVVNMDIQYDSKFSEDLLKW